MRAARIGNEARPSDWVTRLATAPVAKIEAARPRRPVSKACFGIGRRQTAAGDIVPAGAVSPFCFPRTFSTHGKAAAGGNPGSALRAGRAPARSALRQGATRRGRMPLHLTTQAALAAARKEAGTSAVARACKAASGALLRSQTTTRGSGVPAPARDESGVACGGWPGQQRCRGAPARG